MEAQYQVDRNVAHKHYRISTDQTLLNLDIIHGYLYHSYWSPGIPRELVEQSIVHSLTFGLYYVSNKYVSNKHHDSEKCHQSGEELAQVGFARVVTDYTSFAYLADVFVLQAHRGQGLGIWLIEAIVDCPQLHTVRSFTLATRDAHELYRKYGFEAIDSERYMIKRSDIPWRNPALTRE